MSLSPDQIVDALLTFAGEMEVGSPALPIAMPDVEFTAPADGKYLVVTLFPNRHAWEGLSSGRMAQGLLQVAVVWPRNEGIVKPAVIAAAVEAYFAKNTAIPVAGGKITVYREPWTSAAITEPDKTTTPVTISYRT